MIELNKIYNEDCLEGMKLLDDNSIDSIVTDPPYELGFMGKKWDSTGIAYNVDVWRECLRVLKPGGHLLAFGGTRTYHRMACAIEDAGFEIRDQIQWIYGSGFPKSHDISKAIDKKFGAERKIVGLKPYSSDGSIRGNSYNKGGYERVQLPITAPATPEAQEWEGWGTALKPANEPIVLARKPLSEKTVAENVLKWGTGGLNIDGCRIGTDIVGWGGRPSSGYSGGLDTDTSGKPRPVEGRFPANVILDEEAGRMLDEQQEGASRCFYCAKASKKERGEGNNHPTVKPVSLIKYLVTLVTPPDGVCLDPFMGSGTTAVACINTKRNYIGFELDKDYYKVAKERLEAVKNQVSMFTNKPIR
jgi:site-specific DNA-methyltransferase (adenine-specific)